MSALLSSRSLDGGVFEADGKRWTKRGDAFFRADFDDRKPRPPVRFSSLADAKAASGR